MLNAENINIDRPCPKFLLPEVKSYYSLDRHRNFVQDLSSLKYLCDYRVTLCDLNKGFESFVKKPDSAKAERIDHLLMHILNTFDVYRNYILEDKSKFLLTDILCFRGLLTKVMITPYINQEWTIGAINWKGTIYLCKFDQEESVYPNQERFCYWGYKFEQLIFSKSPFEKPNTKEPVYESEEFCCVFSSKINDITITYGAEIDGIESNQVMSEKCSWSNIKFKEVKTTRVIETKRQDINFKKYKLIKFWCQSFLVAIKDIIVGFRDREGYIKSCQIMPLINIRQMCKGIWYPNVCLNFLYDFINGVKLVTAKENDPKLVWKFHYSPETKVVTSEKVCDFNKYAFLPSWYTEKIEVLNRGS